MRMARWGVGRPAQLLLIWGVLVASPRPDSAIVPDRASDLEAEDKTL